MVALMTRYAKTPPPPALPRSPPTRRSRQVPVRVRAARKRLGPEIVEPLVYDYEAGESMAALCQTYGLGKGTVLSLLAEQRVKMHGQGLPDSQLPEAKRLYVERGLPLRRIGPRLGCSPTPSDSGYLRAGVLMRKPWERRSGRRS